MKKLAFLLLFSCAIPCWVLAADTITAIPENITADPQFKAIQSQIVSDEDVMADIQALLQDPEVMALIADPALMAAAQSGDKTSLESNPRIQALTNNPKVQALIEKIKAKQPPSQQ